MDEFYIILIFMGITSAILGLIWSCTRVKTTTIEAEKNLKIAERKAERDENMKKIELEGITRTNSTTQSVSTLQNETHRQKNQFDFEIQNKSLNVQTQALETMLGERKLIEEGKFTRKQLDCKTQLGIADLNYDFKNKELNAGVEMFGRQLDFNRQIHERDDNTKRLGLEYTKNALEEQEKTKRYQADRAFDGLSMTEIHKDNRLKSRLDAETIMHHDTVNLKRDLGTKSIESNERINMRDFECRMHEASEMRTAAQIEADKDRDIFSTIVSGVTGMVTGGGILGKGLGALNAIGGSQSNSSAGGLRQRTLPSNLGGLGQGSRKSSPLDLD